jgi:exodeoxyribonuclease V alpha subunit
METKLDFTIDNLKALKSKDGFADIDLAFAEFITGLAEGGNKYLFLAAAMASYKVRRNHVCADLQSLAESKFPQYSSGIELQKEFQPKFVQLPGLKIWKEEIKEYRDIIGNGEKLTPLVLDSQDRLFLHKYWNYEVKLSRIIQTFINTDSQSQIRDIESISDRFQTGKNRIDWQLVALFAALRNRFTIITGGPGTGKTTIIISILAKLLEHDPDQRIAICAPTGKAAARIKESLNQEISHLNCSRQIIEKLQKLNTSTIHRLLGPQYHSPFFKHDDKNKLPHDVVVVDESSMVDLPLMTKLLQAIRKETRIILLGDKDQLASVESGAVLNDLCESAEINHFSRGFRDAFAACCRESPNLPSLSESELLDDHIIELKENYRFKDQGGIFNLKEAIRSGRSEKAKLILKSGDQDLVGQQIPAIDHFSAAIIRYIEELTIPGLEERYVNYKTCDSIQAAWRIISSFKILCSHKKGPFGADRINTMLKNRLLGEGEYPPGLPIMVTQNQPDMQLYNGDIGLVWKENGQKRAFFPDVESTGGLRSISLSQLPVNKAVFAMTVHKSQGSGFEKVLLVLPNRDSPLLTRELIYTGITRTRRECEIWTDYEIFEKAVSRRVSRNSGLRDRLQEVY